MLFFQIAISSLSQSIVFGNGVETVCSDGVTPVIQFTDWEAYQTLDNTFNGEHDNSICISLADGIGWNQPRFVFDEIDLTRPVFLRYSGNTNLLSPNSLYNIHFQAQGYESFIDLYDSVFCDDDVCQGIIVGIDIPDDPDDLDDLPERRWTSQEFTLDQQFGWGFSPICFSSENFESGQVLKEVIFKFKFFEDLTGVYEMYDPFIEQIWNTNQLNSETIEWYRSGALSYSLWDQNYLVVHDPNTFPNLNNYTSIELIPSPNSTVQETVTLDVFDFSSLTFEPFTQFIGALVEGQSDLRHNVLLNISGGNICMNYFFELILHPGDELFYNAGMLSLAPGTCIRFEKDALLHVAEDASLQYGEQGMGTLAMNSGSQIVLDKNASLHCGNIFSLWDTWGEVESQNVHIYLKPGNSLVFDEFASISNRSADEKMKLMIHLEGGFLDLSGLDDQDLKHVIVLPSANEDVELLQVYGNPCENALTYSIMSNQDQKVQVIISDATGRELVNVSQSFIKGYNLERLNVSNLSSGNYILTLKGVNSNQSVHWQKI